MERDILWAAGFFEGEGCFTIRRNKRGEKVYLGAVASLNGTDLDAITEFATIVQVGKLRGPYRHRNLDHKEFWQWSTGSQQDFRLFCIMMRPLLFSRRIARMDEVLTECGHGSDLIEELV